MIRGLVPAVACGVMVFVTLTHGQEAAAILEIGARQAGKGRLAATVLAGFWNPLMTTVLREAIRSPWG